jgi:anti-sigma B factor antagonist
MAAPSERTEWDTDGQIRCEPASSGYRIVLIGEIDLTLADEWTRAFEVLAAVAACDVTVDLSAATFIDSSALGSLVRLNRLVTERGSTVVLAGAEGAVARTLQLSGLDSVVPMT